ncbi:MAG: CotH kinase family protein [Mesonia sp.]
MFKRSIFIFAFLFSGLFISCEKDLPVSTNDESDEEEVTPRIPHFYIDTDNHDSITSKENYLEGDLVIEGNDAFADYEGRTKIRGRGNFSWFNLPKKSFKLKLNSASPLMDLSAYKKWILLANYLDGSLLMNSIPYKTAHLLEMPLTNHMIPIELTVNGQDRGFYVFTEHKEVGYQRIDIGEDGLLLELDTYFDEALQFKSEHYDLPVMIKYPEKEDMSEAEAQTLLTAVQSDFNQLESLVYDSSFPNNNYLDYFDDLAYVNYMIVYQLTLNREINHPKSTYIHKTAGGKYSMGIIWDFDWGFGYSENQEHFRENTTQTPLFLDSSSALAGTKFFSKFMEDPHMQILFKERWNWFRAHKYSELKKHIKKYAKIVEQAASKDYERWGLRDATGNSEADLQRVLQWLDARANYLDTYVSGL